MIQTAAGWGLDVDRGPDWIFVRVHPRDGFDDAPGLAESVWAVLEQHFIYRVVLELDEIALLHSSVIGQLVLLSKRIHSHGGLVRLCGVSETNREVLLGLTGVPCLAELAFCESAGPQKIPAPDVIENECAELFRGFVRILMPKLQALHADLERKGLRSRYATIH